MSDTTDLPVPAATATVVTPEPAPMVVEPAPIEPPVIQSLGKTVVISPEEHNALWQLLDRNRTSAIVHGGLRGLLSLKENDYEALMTFLHRVAAL